jgi:hypothetical protein
MNFQQWTGGIIAEAPKQKYPKGNKIEKPQKGITAEKFVTRKGCEVASKGE